MDHASCDLIESIRPLLQQRAPGEPVELPSSAVDAVAALLDRAAQDRATAIDRLYPVLQLIVALQDQLQSPAAAEAIIQALHRAPDALRAIRGKFKAAGGQRGRPPGRLDSVGLRRLIGTPTSGRGRAPLVGESRPAGSIRVADVLSGEPEPGTPARLLVKAAGSVRRSRASRGGDRRAFRLS